ncbi:MAG TPA: threonine--tRNA ligase, partial [Candidatus Marinimicrobia bacterium]|nr:threonine--tRNA ligase [Candidatus Neomarinimicrobiota bacterium]
LWIQTEQDVRKALDEGGINYTEKSGEAAFYGPKIDVQVWSTVGRKFTLATNQVDFAIPSLFGLNYMNERGEEVTPLCIHRAPLGTHERFIGFLIEHYNADFPLWLAPVQVAILTVSEKVENYAKSVQSNLQNVDVRVDLDDRPDKIGAKIRRAELSKINIMLIIGEQEAKKNTVSVRRRFEGDIGSMNVDNLTSKLVEEINQRRNTYRKEG